MLPALQKTRIGQSIKSSSTVRGVCHARKLPECNAEHASTAIIRSAPNLAFSVASGINSQKSNVNFTTKQEVIAEHARHWLALSLCLV